MTPRSWLKQYLKDGNDPRTLKGLGIACAIAERDACHSHTIFYQPEFVNMIPMDQIEGKAEMLLYLEDRPAIFDTLILLQG